MSNVEEQKKKSLSPKKKEGTPKKSPPIKQMSSSMAQFPKNSLNNENNNNNIIFKDMKLQYLPSRFSVNEKVKPITYSSQKVLEDMEQRIDQLDVKYNNNIDPKNLQQKERETKNIVPSAFRVTRPHEFKNKPLRRQESDFLIYKEIFVAPKEKMLTNLKEKEKDFENLFHDGMAKQYEKILHIYDPDKDKTKKITKYLDDENNLKMTKSKFGLTTLKEEVQVKQTGKRKLSPDKEADKLLSDNMHILEQALLNDQSSAQSFFFDQQIQVQPPNLPNATIASPLTPGNGYAPSVPLTHNFKDSKSNIKDLLVRAKAGMQAGDIQKEAHLSFYLGMVYEASKSYKDAVRYYKKFFTCARMMEDKIGLSLGANRIAINYFNDGNYEKAIEYHKQNIQLSDIENTFAGFYNIGISQRKNQNFDEALLNFKKALEWAVQRDEIESECLAYGQLGVTNNEMRNYEEALDNFTNCYELSRKLKNTKLQLDCLLFITKITSYTSLKNSDNAIKVLRDAVDCARQLEDKKTSALCICNLGVLEGGKKYNDYQENNLFEDEFEDADE